MPIFLLLAAIVLVLALLIGLYRAARGPTLEDRLTSVLLLGTGGVALLFILATLLQSSALIDVALLLALLAAVVSAAMTRREVGRD